MSRPTSEERQYEREEETLEFMRATSEALQQIVVVLREWQSYEQLVDVTTPAAADSAAVRSVLWALDRMMRIRKQGEPARFRVSWIERSGARHYRLDLRRVDGTIERYPGPALAGAEHAVEESEEMRDRTAVRRLVQQAQDALIDGDHKRLADALEHALGVL